MTRFSLIAPSTISFAFDISSGLAGLLENIPMKEFMRSYGETASLCEFAAPTRCEWSCPEAAQKIW